MAWGAAQSRTTCVRFVSDHVTLFLVGFSHQSSSFDLLGRIAISAPFLPLMLQRLAAQEAISEVAGLATCNRTEFYCVASSREAARHAVLRCISESSGVPPEALAGQGIVLQDADAVRHLLAVACGIDSLIVGELEIAGQVRRALEVARECDCAGPVLENLFVQAMRTARTARRTTRISRGNVSVASAAVTLIAERLGDLGERRALVIGSGKVGCQVLRALAEAGVSAAMLTNRTEERAKTLAEQMGCTPVPLEKMVEALDDVDIVICSTGAPHYVVTREMIAQNGRAGRPRIFVDLSAPPNIEPAIAECPGAVLLTIGDLHEIAERNTEGRREAITRVEELIEHETTRIVGWTGTRSTQEVVRDFRLRMEGIRRGHLDRHAQRFDDQTRRHVDRLTRSLVDAMLHEVTSNLSGLHPETPGDREKLAAARELFGLDVPASALPEDE